MPKLELTLNEIPINQPHGLEHDGQPIVLIRQGDSVSAFVDRCPHAGWKLSEGDLYDGVIECPGHSWEFHGHDGKCITVPAHCLTSLNVQVQNDAVCIEWEDDPDE